MAKGKVFVVEGACDGIGKTTQFTLLKDHLMVEGKRVVTHHFPSYDTYQGKAVEMYLQGAYGKIKDLSPYFINTLYATDRAITWHTELKQSFLEGQTILFDRYTTSSLIYQSALIEDLSRRKAFIDYIVDFEYDKLELPQPDKVIFLTASFDLITNIRKARRENAGVSNDIHEKDLDFMRRVYDNAMFIADYLNWDQVQCDQAHHMKSIANIHDEIYQLVKKA